MRPEGILVFEAWESRTQPGYYEGTMTVLRERVQYRFKPIRVRRDFPDPQLDFFAWNFGVETDQFDWSEVDFSKLLSPTKEDRE